MAGVGLTPMQSMLETLVAEGKDNIHYLHACETPAQHSFKKRLSELEQQGKVKSLVWYKSEGQNETKARHGFMDIAAVEDQLPLGLDDHLAV